MAAVAPDTFHASGPVPFRTRLASRIHFETFQLTYNKSKRVVGIEDNTISSLANLSVDEVAVAFRDTPNEGRKIRDHVHGVTTRIRGQDPLSVYLHAHPHPSPSALARRFSKVTLSGPDPVLESRMVGLL